MNILRIFVLLFVFISKNSFADNFDYHVSLLSSFVGSGGGNVCDKPVAQGGISYSLNEKVALDFWTSEGSADSCDEIDYSLIYKVNNKLTVTFARYDIPGDAEINAIKFSGVLFNVPSSINFMNPQGNSGNGYEIEISKSIGKDFSLGLNLGKNAFDGDGFFTPSVTWSKAISTKVNLEIKARFQDGGNQTLVGALRFVN